MSQLNLFLYSVSFEEITKPNTRCNEKTIIRDLRECDLAASLFLSRGASIDKRLDQYLWVRGCSYHFSKEDHYVDKVFFNPRPKDGKDVKKHNYKAICKAPCKF